MIQRPRRFVTNFLLAWLAAMPALGQSAADGRATQQPLAPLVKTITVGDSGLERVRRFPARIAARETVDLAFEVGGLLDHLGPAGADPVRKGDVLAQLDLAPLERAAERARLGLTQAERTIDRLTELAGRNAAPRVQLDDAATARDLAIVTLADAERNLRAATLRAPFDGIVARRIGTPFSVIEPGQPVLRVHDLSEVRAQIELPERILTASNRLADVLFSAQLPGAAGTVQLELAEFAAETSDAAQSYLVSLRVPAPHAAGLIPGMRITVTMTERQPDGGLVLPASAVVFAPDRSALVYAVEPEGDALRLRAVPVRLASGNGTALTVLGLEPGTEIVEVGGHMLHDGALVRRYLDLGQQS
ncbi:MAG: efflux RND transporter periplasmic adaptor subunit [Paracoccus hibiscisoli]|uniref:efflux RND transporter periplasmic adaptor subunit n=1 Tax=Paracoccus hibiscisoli TaxID=2023261 RepID=UPI00391DAF20